MKKVTLKLLAPLLLCGILHSCGTGRDHISGSQLEKGFKNIPDSVQTSVYWYWISGNISKEGVIKDLESMKEAEINRAFIGNIGLSPNETPEGPVKLFTDEWWEIVHAALKRATELGIEIGMFNCPGWSQAGGPWIEPGQAMRYLASTKTMIEGGGMVNIRLDRPEGEFEDVMVLALPCPADYRASLTTANAAIAATPSVPAAANLIDGDMSSELTFVENKRVAFDITADADFPLRSIELFPAHRPVRAMAEVQIKKDGRFETVSRFEVNRTNPNIEVGFVPYAPITVTVPTTVGREFRIVLSDMNPGSGILEMELSSMPKVERYSEKTLARMFQEPLPYWKEYQWPRQPELDDPALAVPVERVLDVTGSLSGDDFAWDAPEGDWIILRMGMTPTGIVNSPAAPEGTGYEVDKMTSAYMPHHFDSFIGEILRRIPARDRKSFKVVVADSYEKGGQNFTDEFLKEFEQRYGYDPKPFLPSYYGYVVGSRDASDRFLWDMRRLLADKLSYEHIGALRKIANKHGMTVWLENYGHWGFPGEFLQYGGQSDEIGGEFWSEGPLGDIENRAASSCAHIYGKQKVSAESFTCGGWAFSRYPATMKQRGDRFFSEGINNTLLSVYISQYEDPVPPGLNAGFGNEFNRLNTWFSHIDLFTDYLKRTNFMLQQGVNVADVAYFIGEDAPKMTGITDPALPKGYQYDYINAEVIIDRMTVKNGLLTLPHGTQYRMMVLPRLETMRPELLSRIRKLIYDGGVVMGPPPDRSPSLEDFPQADRRVREMASELWGQLNGQKHAPIGKGMLMTDMTMEEALALTDCIPDCKVSDNIPVLYGHRCLGATQVYYLTNQSGQPISFIAEFRVRGMQPEAWDPVSGNTRLLPAYEQKEKSTAVPLKLEAFESVFVVFRREAGASGKTALEDNYPQKDLIATVRSPWTVIFESTPAKRGPAEPVVLNQLYDLSTTSDNDDIQYYSGAMVYTTSFDIDRLPADGRIFLDLGEVAVMAKVGMNGKYAGGVWTAPYELDVTDLIKSGDNRLEVEVVNTWVNRLIGDSRLPQAERPTFTPNNPWTANSPLQKSGLIGPVTIHTVKKPE